MCPVEVFSYFVCRKSNLKLVLVFHSKTLSKQWLLYVVPVCKSVERALEYTNIVLIVVFLLPFLFFGVVRELVLFVFCLPPWFASWPTYIIVKNMYIVSVCSCRRVYPQLAKMSLDRNVSISQLLFTCNVSKYIVGIPFSYQITAYLLLCMPSDNAQLDRQRLIAHPCIHCSKVEQSRANPTQQESYVRCCRFVSTTMLCGAFCTPCLEYPRP